MSTYLKPQSPLYSKENDAFFYPLTTSDQVIMPDGSRLTPDKLETMILEIATPDAIGALSMELLWENASPTSEFDGQDINVAYDPDDLLLIQYKDYYEGTGSSNAVFCKPGYTATINAFFYVDTDNRLTSVCIRNIDARDLAKITFSSCATKEVTETKTNINNKNLVPTYIYRIRRVPT